MLLLLPQKEEMNLFFHTKEIRVIFEKKNWCIEYIKILAPSSFLFMGLVEI